MTLSRPPGRIDDPESHFREAFTAHYAAVYGYAARRLGHEDAADAAAEVFTVAWRRLASMPGEPDTLPWLYGVARKVVANSLRSRRRLARLEARAAALAPLPHADAFPDPVIAVLKTLSPRDREILRLAAWEGLGPADLGSVLGCSANAAAVRLHRARRRLRDASALWDSGGTP